MNIPGFTVEDRRNSKVVIFPNTDLTVGIGIELVVSIDIIGGAGGVVLAGSTSVHMLT